MKPVWVWQGGGEWSGRWRGAKKSRTGDRWQLCPWLRVRSGLSGLQEVVGSWPQGWGLSPHSLPPPLEPSLRLCTPRLPHPCPRTALLWPCLASLLLPLPKCSLECYSLSRHENLNEEIKKRKKRQGNFSPVFQNQLTGTSCLLGPNWMMGINEPVMRAPIRSCQMSPPPPVPTGLSVLKANVHQASEGPEQAQFPGERPQRSEQSAQAAPFPRMELSPLIHPTLPYPSILPSFLCAALMSQVSEHPQVHLAIVNSTQVKGADPGAVFPDWPQILFSLFASSLKKRQGRKPHYCCLAVLWCQRKQNRNICRCSDECNYKIHQRSCPSSFRLLSRTVSLFFAFPSLGAQLLPWDFSLWSSAAASTKGTRSTQRFPLEPTPSTDSFLFLKTLASSIALS